MFCVPVLNVVCFVFVYLHLFSVAYESKGLYTPVNCFLYPHHQVEECGQGIDPDCEAKPRSVSAAWPVPRLLSSLVPRLHSALFPRLHSALFPRLHSTLFLLLHSVLAPRLHSTLVWATFVSRLNSLSLVADRGNIDFCINNFHSDADCNMSLTPEKLQSAQSSAKRAVTKQVNYIRQCIAMESIDDLAPEVDKMECSRSTL